jgi:hypothetical protein
VIGASPEFSPSIIENYSGTVASSSLQSNPNPHRRESLIECAVDSLLNNSNHSLSSASINAPNLVSNLNTANSHHTNNNSSSSNSANNIATTGGSTNSSSELSLPNSSPSAVSSVEVGLQLHRHSHGMVPNTRDGLREVSGTIGMRGGDGSGSTLTQQQQQQQQQHQQQHAIREAGVQLIPPSFVQQQLQYDINSATTTQQNQNQHSVVVLKRQSQDGRVVDAFNNGDADRERKTLKKKPNIQVKPNEPLVDCLAPAPVQQVNHSPALISLLPTTTVAQGTSTANGTANTGDTGPGMNELWCLFCYFCFFCCLLSPLLL